MKHDRRQFLAGLSAVAAAGMAGRASAQALGPLTGPERRTQCYTVRMEAARQGLQAAVPAHPDNGDEKLYSNFIGNYSKGLPHNSLGEVNPDAYQSLLTALQSGQQVDFENIIMGAPTAALQMKEVDPQAGLAYDMEGTDSHQCTLPPAPALASAEAAGELVENYWMALTRDVPFTEYSSNAIAQAAANDLTQMSDFQGPKVNGQVTAATLFRGFTAGDLIGPWLSQFLWQPVPFGAITYAQQIRTGVPGVDYMTNYSNWLSVQEGVQPAGAMQFDPTLHYVRNGRDMSQWVHMDVLYQAYFQALQIMWGMNAPLNPGNPYLASTTQTGFGTWGQPHFAALVAEVATRALKGVWFEKWLSIAACGRR